MKPKPPPKLAVALQMYAGDSMIAVRLMELIVSIEKDRRDDIEFIVSARRGTPDFPIAKCAELARSRFVNVRLIEGKRFGSGWPMGCNDLWQETMMRSSQMKRSRQIEATGVLTIEPDIVPLRPDWLTALALEWREAQLDELECLGHICRQVEKGVGPVDHVNGNGIFAVDLLRKYTDLNGSSGHCGWDVEHCNLLMSISKDTPLIQQLYDRKSITRDEIEEVRNGDYIPAFLHGVKGTSALEAVEAMVADKSFFTRMNKAVAP